MTSTAVQLSDVSSTLPALFPEDVLQALDGFGFIISPQGHIEFVSDNVTEILHYSPDELRGRSLYSFLAVDSHFELSNCLCTLSNPTGASEYNRHDRPYVFNCRMSVKPRSITHFTNTNKGSSAQQEQQRFENIQISVHTQQQPTGVGTEHLLQSPVSLQPPSSVTPTSVDSAISTKNSSGLGDLNSSDLSKSSNLAVTNSNSSTPPSPLLTTLNSQSAQPIVQSTKLVCIAKRRRSAQAAAHLLSHMGMQQFHMRLDLSGTILEYDGSNLHSADYQIANCIGSNIRDFCIEHDRHLVDELFRTAIDKGTVWKVYRFKFSDSVYAFVQTEFSLVRSNSNQPQCIYAIHTIVRECDSDSILKGSSTAGLIKSVMQTAPSYARTGPPQISSSIQSPPSTGAPYSTEPPVTNFPMISASQQLTPNSRTVQSSAVSSTPTGIANNSGLAEPPLSQTPHPNVVYNPHMQQMLDQNGPTAPPSHQIAPNNYYVHSGNNPNGPMAGHYQANSRPQIPPTATNNNYPYYNDVNQGYQNFAPSYVNDMTSPGSYQPYPSPAPPPPFSAAPRSAYPNSGMPGSDRRVGDLMDPMSTGMMPALPNYPQPPSGYGTYHPQVSPGSMNQSQIKHTGNRMMPNNSYPGPGSTNYPGNQHSNHLNPPPLPSSVSNMHPSMRPPPHHHQQLHQMHTNNQPPQNMMPAPPHMYAAPTNSYNIPPQSHPTAQSNQLQKAPPPSTYYDAPPPDRPLPPPPTGQSVEMLEQLLGDPAPHSGQSVGNTQSPSLLMMMMGPSDVSSAQANQSPDTTSRHSVSNRTTPGNKRGDSDSGSNRLKRSGSNTSPADNIGSKRGRSNIDPSSSMAFAGLSGTNGGEQIAHQQQPNKQDSFLLDMPSVGQQHQSSLPSTDARASEEESSIFSWLESDMSNKQTNDNIDAIFNQVQPPSAIPTSDQCLIDPQQASYVSEFMALGQTASSSTPDQITSLLTPQMPSPQQKFQQDQKQRLPQPQTAQQQQQQRKTHKSGNQQPQQSPLVAVVAPSSQPGTLSGMMGGDYSQQPFINTNCPIDSGMNGPQMWGNVASPLLSRSPGSINSQGPYMNSPNSMVQNNWNGPSAIDPMNNRYPPDRPGPMHDFVRQRLAGHCNNRQQQQLQQRPTQYSDYGPPPPPPKDHTTMMQDPSRSQPSYAGLNDQPYGDGSFASPRSNMAPSNSPRQSAAVMPMGGPRSMFPSNQPMYGNSSSMSSPATPAMIRNAASVPPSRPNNLMPMDRSPYGQSSYGNVPIDGGPGSVGGINYQASALSQLLQDPFPAGPNAGQGPLPAPPLPPPPSQQMNMMLSSNTSLGVGGQILGMPGDMSGGPAGLSRNIDPSILEELLRD